MKIAFYIGGYTSDKLSSRIGWALIRHTQKGAYGQVTHVEAIHAEHPDGKATLTQEIMTDRISFLNKGSICTRVAKINDC